LHASEEKYRDLINGMNDTICVIDFDTAIVDVNNAATRVLGYTRDEMLALKIPDIDANLAPDQIQNLASSMPHDKVQVFETWHKTKTGERLPVEVSSSLVSYGGQTVILSIARDITERKHSEETLRRSQAELSQALQIAKLGYWEYDVAKDLFLLNDQFYAIFHTTAEQAGGYQLSSAQYARQFVYPDDLPVVGAEIEKALSSTDRHYSRQIDHRILYADGRVGYISVNINIDRDEQGQILRYYGANQDITERKQAEIALAREQSLMDALMLNAPDTLYFKDLNSRFIRISQSQALHFGLNDPAEAIGKSDFDFFTEEHARPAFEDEQQIMRTGLSLTKEEVETWQDRTPTWVLTTKLPLRDEAGNIVGTFGMSKDITERKLAEAGREKLLTEQRRRAFQLQTAAEVSRATSSILSVDELLPQAAELIRARFDLYYVGIFLNDEADQWAVLRAGTGDAGQQMLANGHRLKIGRRSMISQCIVNQQARIALDVGEEAVRFDNPQLPMTRSELALPLVSRGHVIGAVTIQSDQPAAFTTDDITVLQTMADQIGNAIENARLYEQSSAALREIDDLNRRLTGEGWETYLQLGSNRQLILARDNEALAPAALTAVDEQLAAGQIVVEPTPGAEQQTTVTVPVMLRGQTIGALRIAMPQAAYTNELRTTLESLAGHVAQAAENARLLDETQARFARERALGSATEKIRSRSDVEHILKTAAEELAHYLQASAINVRLGSSVTAGDKTGQPG
jgi:PAS domain S-box-containing protein